MSNSAVKEVKTNSFTEGETDSILSVKQTKRYNSFMDFLYSPDCGQGVPITDLDNIKAKAMPSLELYNKLMQTKHEHDSLVKKNEEFGRKIADVVTKRQEIVKSIMGVKAEKEAILSSIATTPTEGETKKLGELSISIEVLQRQAENLVREESTLRKQKISDEGLKTAKDACISTERAFFKAVAVELTAYLFASKELKWLWGCYAKTTSKTFLRDILKDCFPASGNTLEYSPKELESTVTDIFGFYESKKEGK